MISFSSLLEKYGTPRGVIHIGAHMREEKSDYISAGINELLWIEANPKVFASSLSKGLSDSELFFNEVIAHVDDQLLDFKITNNGQSSSILDLDKHKTHHPQVHVTETIKVRTKRFDTLVKEKSVNIDKYNFLNLDIQGAELLALKSFGGLLSGIDYIYTEVNVAHLYKDCALMSEIDEYLTEFERVETSITRMEWGDAFYKRIKW